MDFPLTQKRLYPILPFYHYHSRREKAMRLKLAYGHRELWLQFPEDTPVNVAQVLESVKDRHPELYELWCDSQGRLRSSLAVFVNSEHIRYLKDVDTRLSDGDEVYVIPMIAGG